MQKYKSNITTTSGAAVRGVPVLVIDEDGNNAALFLDRAGTYPAPNPLTTGPDGVFYFYAVNGRYSLRTTVDGVTITDDDVVLMMDPEEITVAGPIAEAVAAAQAAAIAAQAAAAGLANVDNTADTDKPVSTAQQTALDLKANLASPTLTGTPTAPTAAAGTSTDQLATTAFVNAKIANAAPTKTGGGASGTWPIAVTGSAPTLTTARTINGVSFDGSANISIDAAAVPNTPAGSIAATTVQAAINELDTEKVSLTGDQTIAGTKTFSSFPVLPMPGDLFRKADSSTVVFTKTGERTAQIKAGTLIDVGGTTITFAAATAITMPALTEGTDYAIYACTDGTVRADASFSAPSGYTTANSRKIGGFHYAPGGNATAQSGGNTTPQINEFSFWDLKFKPACADPRGMTLVAGGFWVDIYLTGVDAITNGSSRFNVVMADGSSPPKVPTLFGGNGSTTYGSYTWFQAMELATAFGKRCPTQQEFMAFAYGTTEASSIGAAQVSTVLNAAYTSRWGVIQAAGVLWVWGLERGGPFASAAWNANTGGRGSEYNAPNAALLGGHWGFGSFAGSRCSAWGNAASASVNGVGSRFCCDHLQLD